MSVLPSRYTYSPSGALCLRINESAGSGHRRQWSDGQKRLETLLDAVVVGLVRAAGAIRGGREARERHERERAEEQRRREDRERLQRREAAQAQDFENKLAAWERAGRIRAFAAAVRAAAVARDGSIVPGGELDRWLAWAQRRAARLDPLTSERVDRRWPPPAGHAVKLPEQGFRGAWADGANGTPVLPPGGPAESSLEK